MFKSRAKFLALMACFSVFLLCGTLAFCLQTQNFGSNVNIQYIAPKDFLTYELNSAQDGWIVTGYDKEKAKNATSLNIPQQHNENGKTLPVVEVAPEAFKDVTQFTTLTIGEKVKSLGNGAFYSMTNLTEINFNATDMADFGSSDSDIQDNNIFTYAGTNSSGITVNFGDEVTHVPSFLFLPQYNTQTTEAENYIMGHTSSINFNLVNLKTLNLNNVQTIGEGAFCCCANLTDIVLPDSVRSVGLWAFLGCIGAKTLTIGKNVQELQMQAFMALTNLVEINYNATSLPDFIEDDFALSSELDSPDDAFNIILGSDPVIFLFSGSKSEGITINFGDDVKHVPGLLFSSLVDIQLGFEMGSIDCVKNIKNINFNNVETIGAGAFAGSLMNLENSELVLPEGVTYVADLAFAISNNVYPLIMEAQNRSEDFPTEEDLIKYIKDNLSGLNTIHLPKSLKDFGAAISLYTIGLPEMIIDSPDIFNMQNLMEESNYLKLLSFGGDFTETTKVLGLRMIPDIYIPTGSQIASGGFLDLAVTEGMLAKAQSKMPGYDLYRQVDFVVPFYNINNNSPEFVTVTNLNGVQIDGVEEGEEFKISITNPHDDYNLYVIGANYNEAQGTYTAFDNVEIYYTSPDSLLIYTQIEGGYSVKAASNAIGGDLEIPAIHNKQPVLQIEDNAFKDCKGLTSISIPDTVTSVGEYAFYNCSNITSITIGKNVQTLGKYSFYGLVNLTQINFNAINMADCFSVDLESDNPFGTESPESLNNYIFTGAGMNGQGIIVNFGDGVTHVPGGIFAPQIVEQMAIASYIINGQDFETFGSTEEKVAQAISSPVNITKINFNQVQTIGAGAFAGALINYEDGKLVLPEGITSIDYIAFANNSNIIKLLLSGVSTSEAIKARLRGITSVHEPSSLTSVGLNILGGTVTLNEIIIDNPELMLANIQTQEQEATAQSGQVLRHTNSNLLNLGIPACVDKFYVPEGTVIVKNSTLHLVIVVCRYSRFPTDKQGYSLYTTQTPEYYMINNNSSFYIKVTDLKGNEIQEVLPNQEFKVEIINPQEDFELTITNATYNSETDTYTAPSKLSSDFSKLSIDIYYCPPNLLMTPIIGGYSVKAKDKNISGNIVIPNSYGNKPIISIGYNGFEDCDNLTSVTIPNSVITIGNSAFYSCGRLTSVTIGSHVESIGDSAFRYCTVLKEITIPESVTSMGDYAFDGCSGLTSITIPSSVRSVGDDAFNGCRLQEVIIESEIVCQNLLTWEASSSTKTYLIDYAKTIKTKYEIVGIENYSRKFTKSEKQDADGYWVYTYNG